MNPDVEAAFNAGAKLAHLITLHADGRPQVTVVWTGVEDGEISPSDASDPARSTRRRTTRPRTSSVA